MCAKLGVDFLKQIATYMVKSKSFDRVLNKIKITGGGGGRCLAELTVDKEHLNSEGNLHGSFTATLVDNLTTYALMSKPCHPGVSVNLQITHMSSVKEGENLTIDANTVRTGKNIAYIECELRRSSDDTLVAKGSQVKYVDFD